MRELISSRLAALVKQGEELIDALATQGDDDWVDDSEVTSYETWLASVGNLFHVIGGSDSHYFVRFRDIVTTQKNPAGVKVFVARRVFGVLLSALEEWSQGTLQKVEEIFAAAAFDDLLDDAVRFLEQDRRVESCTLSITVLEHAVKRIGLKHHLRPAEPGFDGMVDALTKSDQTGEAERELLAACVGLRRRLELEGWAEADPSDVEAVTRCTRRLIEQYL